MRRTVFLCLTAFCMASIESSSSEEAGESFTLCAKVHEFPARLANAVAMEELHQESGKQLDSEEKTGAQEVSEVANAQTDRMLFRRVADSQEGGETGPSSELVFRMSEVLRNVDEEFAKRWDSVDDLKKNLKELETRVSGLEKFKQTATLKKKKEQKQLGEMERDCAEALSSVKKQVNYIESETSDFGKAIHSDSSQSRISELVRKAKYETLKKSVEEIKSEFEKIESRIGQLFIETRNCEAASKKSAKRKVSFVGKSPSSN